MQYKARHYKTGQPVQIETDNSRIASITGIESEKGLPLAGPPLLDMQVNGYLGYDINDPGQTSPADLEKITQAFLDLGITYWIPTIITNSPENIITLLKNIRQAIDELPLVAKAVPGIHVEGPYIALEDGPRGAHPADCVRPPSVAEYNAWQEACGGMVRLVTFSPEHEGCEPFVQAVAADGAVASIGHANASREQIKAAVDAGASMATHLGNGAHPLVPRHNCYIWELLAEDRVWAGMVGDGFHLPQAQLQNFIRAKTPQKTVLTSDTVYLGGMEPGEYMLGDLSVIMRADGKIVTAANPDIMAGASFHLLYSIENAVTLAGRTRAEAWEMASRNPADMLRLENHPRMEEGDAAVFTLYRWDKEKVKIAQLVDERG